MHAPLALSARLVLSFENDDFLMNAADDTIVVDLPSWRAGLAVIRFDSARGGWGKLIAQAQRRISGADLRVQFRLAGRIIARLGTDTRPGLASRLLGLGPLEVRPLQLVLSVWGRPPAIASEE